MHNADKELDGKAQAKAGAQSCMQLHPKKIDSTCSRDVGEIINNSLAFGTLNIPICPTASGLGIYSLVHAYSPSQLQYPLCEDHLSIHERNQLLKNF